MSVERCTGVLSVDKVMKLQYREYLGQLPTCSARLANDRHHVWQGHRHGTALRKTSLPYAATSLRSKSLLVYLYTHTCLNTHISTLLLPHSPRRVEEPRKHSPDCRRIRPMSIYSRGRLSQPTSTHLPILIYLSI